MLKQGVKMVTRDFNFEDKKSGMVVRNTPAIRSILDYIEKNIRKGYKMDDLRYMLLSQGYSRIDVDEAIKIFEEKTKKDREDAKKAEERRAQMLQAQQKMEPIIEEKKGFWRSLFD